MTSLSSAARYLILICAFLGWLCAGFNIAITSVAMESAAIDLLGRSGSLDVARFHALGAQATPKAGAPRQRWSSADQTRFSEWKKMAARWFAWYQCAFLFGAATGGFVFGRLGDRMGRSKAMAASILTYSSLALASYFADSPVQLLVLWFLASTGVGGMWPNGVALVSEAWSSMSRPMVAGVIGTAANIGIFLLAAMAHDRGVGPESWRWLMLVAAGPIVLGIFSWLAVPESPRWLAARKKQAIGQLEKSSGEDIFLPPLLGATILGITLATIPLIGTWGSANWMVPWAAKAGPNVARYRALTGIAGSLLGGWFGSWLGRRGSYFVVSLAALVISQYIFWFVQPSDPGFLYWIALLGFFCGIYFGWMPLYLPELFPTRVRSTGAGVSFNFGRILTAVTIFGTGALMNLFAGDYARIGRVTSLVFALGLVAACFMPDTSQQQLED